MKRLEIFLSICLVFAGLPLTLRAGDFRPLAVEDALHIRAFFQTPPMFSHDGQWLAYTVIDAETADRQATESGARGMLSTDIYATNLGTSASRELTGGVGSNWMPVWSPDGEFLAFFSTRGGDGRRLWIWDREKDTLRKVFDIEVIGTEIEWTPDSRRLVVATVPQKTLHQNQSGQGAVANHGYSRPAHETSDPTVVVYRSQPGPDYVSEPWSLEASCSDLVLVDIFSGEVSGIVLAQRISKYRISPDGSAIAYTDPVQFEQPGSQQILFDLVTVTLPTKQRRVVASKIRLDFDGAQFSWSPNSRELSFQSGGVLEKTQDCYVVDAYLGGPRNVTNLPPNNSSFRAAVPLWDATGHHLYFIRDGALWQTAIQQGRSTEIARVPEHRVLEVGSKNENEVWTSTNGQSSVLVTYDDRHRQDGFYRVDLANGQVSRLLERGQCYTAAVHSQYLRISDDGARVAYFAEDAQHDADLWISDPAFHSPRRITHLNSQFDDYQLGTTRLIGWLSDDGDILSGAVLLPPDYQKTKRYPTIVWVYGGSRLSENLDHFGLAYPGVFNMQLLATRGYAVLLPDSPLDSQRPMFDLSKAVLPGLNKLIDLGIADPGHLGVAGHSNGGYSALALIAQTRRFKAAVEVDGFANLIGLFGEMDRTGGAFGMSVPQHDIGDTPWQSGIRYIENSPIFYLDLVDTPLLVVHGAEDQTVVPFLGDEIFADLRRLGKRAEYAKYTSEGHSPLYWRYSDQLDLCNRVIAWFDRYLKPPQLPAAPATEH